MVPRILKQWQNMSLCNVIVNKFQVANNWQLVRYLWYRFGLDIRKELRMKICNKWLIFHQYWSKLFSCYKLNPLLCSTNWKFYILSIFSDSLKAIHNNYNVLRDDKSHSLIAKTTFPIISNGGFSIQYFEWRYLALQTSIECRLR